jgi:hypothetical protein
VFPLDSEAVFLSRGRSSAPTWKQHEIEINSYLSGTRLSPRMRLSLSFVLWPHVMPRLKENPQSVKGSFE